jgi:hypothetical protein
MAKKHQPPKKQGRDKLLQVRVTDAEKLAFTAVADLNGQTVSVWIRDVARRAAQAELEAKGRSVAFLG